MLYLSNMVIFHRKPFNYHRVTILFFWYPLLIKRGLMQNPPFISMVFPANSTSMAWRLSLRPSNPISQQGSTSLEALIRSFCPDLLGFSWNKRYRKRWVLTPRIRVYYKNMFVKSILIISDTLHFEKSWIVKTYSNISMKMATYELVLSHGSKVQ